MQCMAFCEKVGQHDNKGKYRADCSCKSCTDHSHITYKDKNVVTDNVENTAGKDPCCGKHRILVVSQKCCKHLIEQKERNRKFDRNNVTSSEGQQIFLCTEQQKQLFIKENEHDPGKHRKNDCPYHCRCKVCICLFFVSV